MNSVRLRMKYFPSRGLGLILPVVLIALIAVAGCSGGDEIPLPEGSFSLLFHPDAYQPGNGMPEFAKITGNLGVQRPFGEKNLVDNRPGFAWGWDQPLKFKVELPPNPVLAFGWGFSEEASKWGKDFKLTVNVTQGEYRIEVANIEERMLAKPDGSTWREEKVNLVQFDPGAAEIEFAFEGLSSAQATEHFLLASPRIFSSGRKDFRRVILIGVDTLRADHLSCYGYTRSTSPNLDEWAAGGTRFGYCVSASPWTFPSFASMLTGRYPSICSATTTVKFMPDDEVTLAEILSKEGFATFAVVNNIWTGPTVNLQQGFDATLRLPVVSAEETFTVTRDWLAEHSDEDTFVFIHFMDPHVPYHPPKPFNNIFDADYSGKFRHEFKEVEEVRSGEMQLTDDEIEHLKALYDGEIAYLDNEFAKFNEFLKAEDMDEDTLIIFTADHGEEFFEHGGFEHGHSLYDEVIWVPLVIRGTNIPPGKVDNRVASTLDIFPTILEHLGVGIPDNINGSSLLKPLPEERLLVAEQILYGEELKGLTTPQYRYIYHTVSGSEELYDLTDDRAMLNSVADDRKATGRQYRAFVTGYITEMGAPWHINFMRTGLTRSTAPYSGTITCAAGFARVDRINLDPGDSVNVEGDTLSFDISIPKGTEKEIKFVTNDESTDVTFKILRNNAPMKNGDIYIGPGLDKMAKDNFTLNINDKRFNLGQPNLQRETHDGVFIWGNPTRFREQLAPELTPEMEEQLRSLGYLH